MKPTNQLKKIIRTSGMSRYALSKASGVTEAALSLFMTGKRGLTLDSVDRLAAVLKLEIITTDKSRKRRR